MAAGPAQLTIRALLAGSVASFVLQGCVPPEVSQPAPRPVAVPGPSTPPVVVNPVPEPPAMLPGSAEPLPAPAPRGVPRIGAASQTLLTQSRSFQAAGRMDQAAASIERALRIEPRQPLLWLELGNIRLKEGNFAQAESMGRKALSLSTGDAGLTARAQQLIATAKKR
jgi:tetratricopeptide (TPR) repeat protein